MSKIRILELCSGYGSQKLALTNLGFNVYSEIAEIDKYAILAYNKLHGETINHGDIYTIDENKLPYFDIVTYSTPCQDFSVAGKQQGGDKGSGTRSSLLWECERIIKAIRPKYLLMENVKNIIGNKHKHNFKAWLKTLEQLGYNNYWQVINAKDYGVPQNRERVFVISIRKDLNKTYTFPLKQELKKGLKDVLDCSVDDKYYISEEKGLTLLEPIEYMIIDDIYNSRKARIYKKYSPTLRSERYGLKVIEPRSNGDYRIRKLTPRECWRLMGVKDKQFDKVSDISNSQLFKMAGNSIVVNVLEEIFKNLLIDRGNEKKGQLILI